MNALRKVLTVKNNEVHFKLPPEYNNTDIEVVIFQLPEQSGLGKVPEGINFSGILKYKPEENIEDLLNDIRSEWD